MNLLQAYINLKKKTIFLHMYLKTAQPSRIFHKLVKAKLPATNSSIHLGHVTGHATQTVNTVSTGTDTCSVV